MLFTLLKFLVTMECCAPQIACNRVNLAFFFFTRHDRRTSQGAQGPTLGAM